ncbi:hypothetical protein [Streptomyces sp. MK5]|uniref:hypothetical protein n=1 Tax=Streptomyces sp. MK5 TaxID=3064253 RepID=UPI0027425572|nr:hypothetical protein [Streptomyces sp. MK5]
MSTDEQADVVVLVLGEGGGYVADTPAEAGLDVVVEDAGRGVPAGAASAGPAGGEMSYGLGAAVHAAVPVDRLRHMIYTCPAFHRAIEAAPGALH